MLVTFFRMRNFIIRKHWIYIWFLKWIYINIENPFKTMNSIRKVFKPLKCYFKFGKIYSPILWCGDISYIHIVIRDVGWKDKYDSPRYEEPPYVWIHLFGLNFIWYWSLPIYQHREISDYWEQVLWYLHYYHTYSQGLLDSPNIEKAKEGWPWEDYHTKESTWTDKFLIK